MILLKDLRKERNLTQSEVAVALKISRQVYANYENEINQPDCKMLVKLANYFDVSIDYLLGITDDFGIRVAAPMGESMNAQERELVEIFRELSPYLKGVALDTVRAMAGAPSGSGLQNKA